jgi:hypothetical protein
LAVTHARAAMVSARSLKSNVFAKEKEYWSEIIKHIIFEKSNPASSRPAGGSLGLPGPDTHFGIDYSIKTVPPLGHAIAFQGAVGGLGSIHQTYSLIDRIIRD